MVDARLEAQPPSLLATNQRAVTLSFWGEVHAFSLPIFVRRADDATGLRVVRFSPDCGLNGSRNIARHSTLNLVDIRNACC